jgi:hypothetical protein
MSFSYDISQKVDLYATSVGDYQIDFTRLLYMLRIM